MSNKRESITFTIFTLLVALINLIVIPTVTSVLILRLLGFLSPVLRTSGEDALVAAGVALWLLPLMALMTFPISYLLSMRLAVYLREKRGWEIRHPRRMFALAMLILLALPILLLLLAPLTK